MLFMPLPFMRGFGLGGLLIPLVSVVCALTLLPVLLYLLADRLDRVRLVPRRIVERRRRRSTNFWVRLARCDHAPAGRRRRVGDRRSCSRSPLPVLWLELGPGSNKGIPQDLEGVQGLNVHRGRGRRGRARADRRSSIDTGPRRAAPTIAGVAGGGRHGSIAGLARRPGGRARRLRRAGRSTSTRRAATCTCRRSARASTGRREALDFVDRLRDDIVPAAGFPARRRGLRGRRAAERRRLPRPDLRRLPVARAGRARADVLPAPARVPLAAPARSRRSSSTCSRSAPAYGLLVVFFKWGGAEPLGLIAFDQIEGWIPVFLFAMLFGLSMDYEVFLVSRMREEWDAGADNEEAVAVGLAKTGRIVTAAGLIMFAAFMGFVAGSILGLQQFGFGLAVGDPDRRHDRPRAARAERDGALRALELVAAGRRRPGLPRQAVAARVPPAAGRLGERALMEIEVVEGDITALEVDAIANAANDHLWLGAGVAGAIKRRGGEEIEREAMAKGPIPKGSAVATGAGRLAARYVIHGVVMGQDLRTDASLVEAATRSCLEVAEELGVRSLALPAFGTGVGGFPLEECARIMVGVVRAHEPRSLERVVLAVYGADAERAFAAALASPA